MNAAKNVERKRKLGRPKESTDALIRQPSEWYDKNANVIEDDSSSSDSDTISDPRAAKKRKISSNDEAQTERS